MGRYEYDAVIHEDPESGGAYVCSKDRLFPDSGRLDRYMGVRR